MVIAPPTTKQHIKPPKIHHLVNHGESTNDLAASPTRNDFEAPCGNAEWHGGHRSLAGRKIRHSFGRCGVCFGRALGIGK